MGSWLGGFWSLSSAGEGNSGYPAFDEASLDRELANHDRLRGLVFHVKHPSLSPEGRALLEQNAARLGLVLSSATLEALERLYEMLRREDAPTALKEEGEIVIKHLLDSLTGLLATSWEAGIRVLDVGSGAGLPGLPLQLARPDLELVLLESVGKKARYLQVLCQELGLKATAILWGRAELWGRDPAHRGRYDRAVIRAVGSLSLSLELGLPFLRPGGQLVVYKGPAVEAELEQGLRAANLLGAELIRDVALELTQGEDRRRLLVFEQRRVVPERFPRAPGLPRKHPLGAS